MTTATQEAAIPLNVQQFQAFYRENQAPIYRYMYSKVRNREEAEDLTSQVFLKAWRHIDQARSLQSTRTWLFRVAHTTVIDYWRSRQHVTTSSLEAMLAAGWEGPTAEEPSEKNSRAVEHAQHILGKLPQKHREVLMYRFLLGFSIHDTAAQTGLTEDNVKSVQFRALKRAAALERAPHGSDT